MENTYEPTQGDLLADVGIARAAGHAERTNDGWQDAALGFLIRQPKKVFTTEDVRKYAHARGLPQPPDPRAWGAVIRRAIKEGLIQLFEIDRSKNPQAHARPVRVWQKIEQVPPLSKVA